MPTLTCTSEVGPEGLAELRRSRDGLIVERALDGDEFTLDRGPFRTWHRRLHVAGVGPARFRVTETIRYHLAIPVWGPLFVLPINSLLRREHKHRAAARPSDASGSADRVVPFWAPPDQFDARASHVLALVCALSLVTGYVSTAITQTVTYAASEFHRSTGDQGAALALVRVGVLIAFVVTAAADQRGRRRLLLVSLYVACLTAALGAVAPGLWTLGASQAVAQGFATGGSLLIGVYIAEEVPAGARAWAIGLLAMATALGAGMCIWVLPLADLGTAWWRAIYVVPLLGIPFVAWAGRHLPETHRFLAHHAAERSARAERGDPAERTGDAPSGDGAGSADTRRPAARRDPRRRISASQAHRRRFWLLAIGSFGIALFVAPMFQLQNNFLRHERHFSAAKISLYTILTSTPGGIGILVGGWLADVRGRRIVAATGMLGGSLLAVAVLFAHGWPMWGISMVGSVVAAVAVPAFGVYGPELFPTLLRGRVNGLLQVVTVAGSSAGLLVAGWLTDTFDRFGPAMSVLLVGPLLVAVLVAVAYPETSGRHLEDLNPEDRVAESGM
ncbi:MAG TPA: MFS transporter [Acidimicrobiales bacterium]|jgi:MFS family permease|nr:MFS transporter [Acidimicrobiales bacterium]